MDLKDIAVVGISAAVAYTAAQMLHAKHQPVPSPLPEKVTIKRQSTLKNLRQSLKGAVEGIN